MNSGLEQRLRTVPGVSGIRIDLGRDGLEGIHVSVDEGSDEAVILEEIRRILVAYGLRSRTDSGWSAPEEVALPTSVWLGEVSGRAAARLRYAHGAFEGFGELNWDGAVKACAEAIAQATGRPIPEGARAVREVVDESQLVVCVLRSGGLKAASVAIADKDGLARALVRAVTMAMDDLHYQLSVDVGDQ